MKRIIFPILLIDVSIIIFAGITPSVLSNDWLWLSRSGSLLTAFGVMLAYLDISGAMKKLTEVMSTSVKEVLLKKDNTIKEEALKEINTIICDVNKFIASKLTFIEFLTIICGTIIWGYGDKFPHMFS